MCPSAHTQEEVGMTGKFAWPKEKWSPAGSSEPLGLVQVPHAFSSANRAWLSL